MIKKLITALVIAFMCVSLWLPVYAAPEGADMYCDVNFDNEGDTNTSWVNTADSGYVFGYSSAASYFQPQQYLTDDEIKGNKAINIKADPSVGAPGHYFCFGTMNAGATTIVPGKVSWIEMSFKFEDNFTRTYFNIGEYPFEIGADGSLFIGGLNGNSVYGGVRVNNLTLELGQWYHLVIAVDNIDKVGNEARYYAWANGKFLETAETPYHGSTCTKAYASSPGHCLFFGILGTNNINFYLDDIKLYTTDTQVRTNDEFCFDPMGIYSGSDIVSDVFKIEEETIYAPVDDTIGELVENMTFGDNGVMILDDGVVLDEDSYLSETAVGKSIVARSDSGVGVRKYSVVEGDRLFGYDRNYKKWKRSGINEINSASLLAKGDTADLTLVMKNDTGAPKKCLLVVAAYNGTALGSCVFKEVEVPVGGGFVTTGALTIDNTENLNLKAYVWNSTDDYTPCAPSLSLE